MFTVHAPDKGDNADEPVSVVWQDGRVTESRIKWYGKGTRSEYRLTKFGRDFPFLTHDNVGDLLVLIPKGNESFAAYVLDSDEDIEEIRAALGLETFEHWAAFDNGRAVIETEDECIERRFRDFSASLRDFPDGQTFSSATLEILEECLRQFSTLGADELLMECVDTEYKLFKRVERQLCQTEITRLFKDVDDFVKTALAILNRRKSRAGRSLENHVHHILTLTGIPHAMRPPTVDGVPDIVIPSEAAYNDSAFPTKSLIVMGVKTTCKDRWRQVLNEGTRVREKFILTLQPGISSRQLDAMHRAGVTLVVPRRLHKDYPRETPIRLMNVREFMDSVRLRLP
jgi:type II restriction enzyme